MSEGTVQGEVLLVGAQTAERRRFTRALERAGLSVRTALAVPATIDGRVDCLVLNHDDGDTVATIESLRERRPELPVVLLAPDDGRLAGAAVAAGVSAFVPRTLADASSILQDRVGNLLGLPVDGSPPDEPPADGGSPVSVLEGAEERRLKERAMDEAPVGITIADADRPDTPLIYANEAFERVTGYPPGETLGRNCRFLQGEETDPDGVRALREAIESEHPVTVELRNYRQNGEPFWNEITIAPVRDEDGAVTHYVGFQNDVTDRKEAEAALERERRNLEHLLDRVNGLLQAVHGDLVETTGRTAIETAVCDRIAEALPEAWCCIARPDAPRNALEVTARAGSPEPPEESLTASLVGESPRDDATMSLSAHLRTAFEEGDGDLLTDPERLAAIAEEEPWLSPDVAGIVTLPLVYRETCYGVLAIGTSDPDTLNDREVVVLEAVARATATAINAIERGRLLSTDAVTEIEFELRDPGLFLVDLSTRLEAAVDYEGGVFHDDGTGQLFCTVRAPPESIEPALAELDVEATVVTAYDDSALVAVDVGAESIVARLAERGGTIRSMTATDGVCSLTVEVPAPTDARAIVSTLEERHPSIELRSFRERDRPPATRQGFVEDLREQLTERQHTAITVAYVSGFYEWNRSVSGEELAKSMGITRSTFHQHRRAAERKLIGAVVDG